MKYIPFILLSALLCLSACSSSKKSSATPSGKDPLLEALTDFSIAINENKYSKAVGFLAEDEQANLRSPDGTIPDNVKKQLQALAGGDIQRLIRNPRIKLMGGKLSGIVVSLPSLEHGQPAPAPEDDSGMLTPPSDEEAGTDLETTESMEEAPADDSADQDLEEDYTESDQ